MAITNGTCVSFCNQPKSHFGLPWVHPCDNRSKCHMDEKEDVQVQKFAILTHFGLPWVVHPWDKCDKCYMDGKRILFLSNA